jgi:hypothetical protein
MSEQPGDSSILPGRSPRFLSDAIARCQIYENDNVQFMRGALTRLNTCATGLSVALSESSVFIT